MIPGATYIIPVCNGGGPDFQFRVKNLQFIYDKFLMAQESVTMEVIFDEQVINSTRPTYKAALKVKPDTKFLQVTWPIFNKGWCINVAAKAAKHDILLIGEADCIGQSTYYVYDMINKFMLSKAKWAFGWTMLQYLSQSESDSYMRGEYVLPESRMITCRPNGAEGGILVYSKKFYLSIGGHSEWIQGLGGPDNEMADRAKWWSGTYAKLEGHIYHIWHPIVKPSGKDKHRAHNKQVIKYQRLAMRAIAKLISLHPIGNPEFPACHCKTYLTMRTGK